MEHSNEYNFGTMKIPADEYLDGKRDQIGEAIRKVMIDSQGDCGSFVRTVAVSHGGNIYVRCDLPGTHYVYDNPDAVPIIVYSETGHPDNVFEELMIDASYNCSVDNVAEVLDHMPADKHDEFRALMTDIYEVSVDDILSGVAVGFDISGFFRDVVIPGGRGYDPMFRGWYEFAYGIVVDECMNAPETTAMIDDAIGKAIESAKGAFVEIVDWNR